MTQNPGPNDTGSQPPGSPGAPAYGTPGPDYGQPPTAPGYGTPAPGYGTPAPGYGTPAPGYGTPAPDYGQQPPAYGQQPPAYGQQPPSYGPAPTSPPLSPAEERQWGMFAHLGGIIGIIPPLIIFLIFKDRGPFAKEQTTEALNWQITMLIGWISISIFSNILSIAHLGFLGTLIWWAALLGNLALCIMAGMAANRGERYRYPFALRFVK